ncbi:MAG TPA: hypothetical protein DCX07_11105 [Phycisphaerales bacterium]|nr:hypothetical protein [Phycisphaerales bacterium]
MSGNELIYALDLMGTAGFAFSGALRGLQRRPDLIGVTILAGATAVGGGMVRDVVLQRPVTMLWDVNYLIVILLAAMVTFLFPRALADRESFFKYFDAVGLGIFSAIGAGIAWQIGERSGGLGWTDGINPISILFIAAITGAGSGVIRDVLITRMPLVLYKEIYILAVLVGAGGLIVVRATGGTEVAGFLAAMFLTIAIRVLAIRYNWSLPRVRFGLGKGVAGPEKD